MKRVIGILLVLVMLITACSCGGGSDDGGTTSPPDDGGGESEVKILPDISVYQTTAIPDLVRGVSAADLVRNLDYVADDAKLDSIVDILDFAVNSVELSDILDLKVAEYVPTLLDKIYNDDIINFAVGYLYPLVEKEFAKVWAGLDPEFTTEVDVNISIVKKASVTATLTYSELEDAMEAIQFYLFPTKLADHLPAGYEAAAAKLRTATTKSVYNKETEVMTSPWDDASIRDEEGNLAIEWGAHDRESFLNAFDAAMIGVKPLLMALLCNTACENRGHIGTGAGTAGVLGNKIKLTLNITSIELVLTATANPGYNNTLAPIFEALGLAAPDGNTFTTVREVLERGLFAPIDTLLATALDKPVSFILSALPNIAYAIEAGLIKPLLSMLVTDIDYYADAVYTVSAVGMDVVNDTAGKAYTSDGPIHIDVGEMVDLDSLGVDLSSVNGLLGMLDETLGFSLPDIDGATLATLGTVVWHDTVRSAWTYTGGVEGKAARIEANRADVLVFLLRYVLNALRDRTLLSNILSKVGSADLPELVYTIIDRVTADPDGVICALCELIIPQNYAEPSGIAWRDGGVPSSNAASLYNDFWTHEKANFMTANLPELIDGVLKMANPEIAGVSASDIATLIDGVTNLVCKAELLNNLAAKIN
ncbi:MAG: hypothetical protein K6C36_01955, partial [Clostridia bacterium]|nr:hypothetical protein [Clostridia bacterium]